MFVVFEIWCSGLTGVVVVLHIDHTTTNYGALLSWKRNAIYLALAEVGVHFQGVLVFNLKLKIIQLLSTTSTCNY